MGIGRVCCVALPFILTLGSLVALLIAGLAGVADKSLFMFEVNTTDLSISPDSVSNILAIRGSSTFDARAPMPTRPGFHDPGLLDGSSGNGDGSGSGSSDNVTAADLGLYNVYDVTLWGYCYVPQNGSRACTKPTFNWAETAMDNSENSFDSLVTLTGQNITLPKDISDALKTFATVTKWTEIVFIIAYVCLAVEIFFGIFANCSRVFSCITFIVAAVASVAVCAAAGLATAMSAVVVGAVEGTAKWYGVEAQLNDAFLALLWIAALCAVAAGFFWLFTICCCAPEHRAARRSRRTRGPSDEAGEKLMPSGAYQPLHEPEQHGFAAGSYNAGYAPQYGAPRYPSGTQRSDLAYEPYSHANV